MRRAPTGGEVAIVDAFGQCACVLVAAGCDRLSQCDIRIWGEHHDGVAHREVALVGDDVLPWGGRCEVVAPIHGEGISILIGSSECEVHLVAQSEIVNSGLDSGSGHIG